MAAVTAPVRFRRGHLSQDLPGMAVRGLRPMDDVKDFAETEDFDDAPAITLGDLRGDETVTLAFKAEATTTETEHGDAIKVEATFLESDYTWEPEDHDGAVENGDDVVLISWSKRLAGELIEAHEDVGLVGNAFEISKSGTGFKTNYSVEHVDETEADD